ncbi:MAG: hypothetical protein AB7Q37_12585 [Pyrinomonadaceae bacterium]
MKRCPECRKDYYDDSLLYCLDDGAALVQGTVTDEPATAILSGDRVSDEGLTPTLKTGGTISRSGPVTLRLPSFFSWERLPWILVAVLAIGMLVALRYAVRNTQQTRTNELSKAIFHLQPPGRFSGVGQLAISPDGKTVAVLASFEGTNRLWVRPIDSLEGRAVAGTDGAGGFPFWSPDGRSIGFVARNKLKRVDLADGTVRDLVEVPPDVRGFGGTWNREGTILYNLGGSIGRIAATGGEPQLLPGFEQRPEAVDRWPMFLPDQKHFIFLTTSSAADAKSNVFVGSIDSPERKLLFPSDSSAVYSPSPDGRGYLLFARGDALLAQGFDPDKLELIGEPFRVSDRIRVNFNSRAFLSVSENGTLIYDTTTELEDSRQLAWFDRAGKEIETVGQPDAIFRFKLSPDERSVATTRRARDTGRVDVLVSDMARGASSRLGSAAGNETPEIIWSPDGKYVVWNEIAEGKFRLIKKLASGAGETEVLLESPVRVFPSNWSPDGKFILYSAIDNSTRNDIWVLPVEGDRTPSLYFRSPDEDRQAVFSPDGRYVAYISGESGRNEIYVQTFPASMEKWTISTNGGQAPRWPAKGSELLYASGDAKIMSVPIKLGTSFEAGVPKPLFDVSMTRAPRPEDFGVSNDGQRLLFISRSADANSSPLVVVLNWSAGLSR